MRAKARIFLQKDGCDFLKNHTFKGLKKSVEHLKSN